MWILLDWTCWPVLEVPDGAPILLATSGQGGNPPSDLLLLLLLLLMVKALEAAKMRSSINVLFEIIIIRYFFLCLSLQFNHLCFNLLHKLTILNAETHTHIHCACLPYVVLSFCLNKKKKTFAHWGEVVWDHHLELSTSSDSMCSAHQS